MGGLCNFIYAGSQPPGCCGVEMSPDAVTGQAVVAVGDGLDDAQVGMPDVDEIAVTWDRLVGAGPVSAKQLDEDPQEQLQHGVAGQRRQSGMEQELH